MRSLKFNPRLEEGGGGGKGEEECFSLFETFTHKQVSKVIICLLFVVDTSDRIEQQQLSKHSS